MKKVFTLLMSFIFVLTLSACLGGGGRAETEVNVLDELPNEPINITVWTGFGQANADLMQAMFDSFNQTYPQVNIVQLSQGGWSGVRDATIQSIVAGTTPTIVMGYPDHFVEYLNGNAVVPLDDFINHPVHGVDLDDFVQGFLDENRQDIFDGKIYAMPFAKSTEMVVYNRAVFAHHGITFDPSEPLTWDQLIEIAETKDIIGSGAMQCEFLINADSAANLFINSSRQWGAPYTNSDGQILVDNPATRDMLTFFQDLIDRNILAFPIEWDQAYGSQPFQRGDVCMSQGSTAGTRHNIPRLENGKFGIFEMGVLPSIQKEGGEFSSMQQGPNIAIISDATDAERLAAWLLIRYMTNTENTANFAMNTGYVPVRISGFETAEYQAFLGLVDLYNEEGMSGLTFDQRDRLPFVQAAAAAFVQVEWYAFDPAFIGRTSSSGARNEAELLFEAIYAGTRTIDEAIRRMLSQLGQ